MAIHQVKLNNCSFVNILNLIVKKTDGSVLLNPFSLLILSKQIISRNLGQTIRVLQHEDIRMRTYLITTQKSDKSQLENHPNCNLCAKP
jgi:hypothetical protein